MQLKRSGPAPSHEADGRVLVCPPPSTAAKAVLCVEVVMTSLVRRSLLVSVLAATLFPAAAFSADNPKTINIDWATYNPVSMLLKDKGLLEKEFAKDGIAIRWVQALGSNKALEFLNAGSI